MATGTRTYKGLAVPIFGESTITQQVAGTDVLTVRSVADSTAANMFAARITASTAVASGYTQGFYVNASLTGGMTGGRTTQLNAFAADITISGTTTAWVSGSYVYICEGATSAEVSAATVSGYVAWFAALGDNCLHRAGFHAGSEEAYTVSTTATVDGAFVAECASRGSWKSLLVAYGGPPEEFLHITETTTEEMYSVEAVGSAAAYLKVNVAGTIMWLTLFASCSS